VKLPRSAGPKLDCWVAKAQGLRVEKRFILTAGREEMFVIGARGMSPIPPYSTDPELAFAIVEREGIKISRVVNMDWEPEDMAVAWLERPEGPDGAPPVKKGVWMAETGVAAAMMCFVVSRLGDVWQNGD
jgi:hypothetical protein